MTNKMCFQKTLSPMMDHGCHTVMVKWWSVLTSSDVITNRNSPSCTAITLKIHKEVKEICTGWQMNAETFDHRDSNNKKTYYTEKGKPFLLP